MTSSESSMKRTPFGRKVSHVALVRGLAHVEPEQPIESDRRGHVGNGDPDRVQLWHGASVLEDDRDRSVVDELDRHARAERRRSPRARPCARSASQKAS